MIKKLVLIVLVFCSFWTYGQVSVTGSLFNEWNASLSALTQLTLVNSDMEAKEVKLVVKLTSSNGRIILTGETNQFIISPGAIVLQGVPLAVLNSPGGAEFVSMKTSGVLPYGNYQYCVKVVQNGVEVLDDWCESIQSEYSEFLNLVYPFDGDTVSTHLPVLSWMNSTGSALCTSDMEYVIRLTKVGKGQTAEQAMNVNPMQWSLRCLNSFQVNYPISALALEDGQTYAWQVQQYNGGKVVNTTDVWKFTINTIPDKKDIKYVHVQKGENPNFIPVFEKLFIRFDDGYNQGEIDYTLLSRDGQPLELGLKSEDLSGQALSNGFNTYEIDVTEFALPSGYYTVVLTNSKKEKFQLKIQVL